MKTTTLFFIAFITSSLNTFAGTNYLCKNMNINESSTLTLKIKTTLLEGKLKEIHLLGEKSETKLKKVRIEETERNLLSELDADELNELNQEDVLYANSLTYQVASTGFFFFDYYYFSQSLLDGKNKGALMIRDAYSYGPFPGSRFIYSLYTCVRK